MPSQEGSAATTHVRVVGSAGVVVRLFVEPHLDTKRTIAIPSPSLHKHQSHVQTREAASTHRKVLSRPDLRSSAVLKDT